MLPVSRKTLGAVHLHHRSRTAAIAAAAAIAGSITTACLLTGNTPYGLYCKGRRWWARMQQQAPEFEADEGDQWPAAGHPGSPRCRPLSTVAELMTWKPPTAVAAAAGSAEGQLQTVSAGDASSLDSCSCTTPLQLPAMQQQPQLLVCHDMMGGYLPEETSLSGAAGCGQYRLWHWDCMDVFCYFSHHMVSIPPKGWIHAAHKHGVKVLGTFITEFGQGRQRCNRLFASRASAQAVADQLVAVACHYGFEGWLVNIENSLSSDQVQVMLHFVGYLRARMKAACSHGVVVWYDAVTTAGELRWQNKLCPTSNGPYFDLADALFLNYCWKPCTLPESVTAAGARALDVLVGVDVHGRGCFGGGGHNTGLALAAAKEAGLSAALFAPGWVYENLGKERFAELQEQWWHKVQAAWGCSHAVLCSLPFSSSFNAGAGLAWFKGGKPMAARPLDAAAAAAAGNGMSSSSSSSSSDGWFNMLLTDTLPSCRDPVSQQVVSGPVVARLTACTAFDGGSCLVICKQQQRALPEATSPATASNQATGVHVAASAQAPLCILRQQQQQQSSTWQQFALLQLFRAAVPVQLDMLLEVTCVYACPPAGSSSSGIAGSSSSSSSTTTGGRHEYVAAPVVWLMTEAAGSAAAAAGSKVIHLPASSSMLKLADEDAIGPALLGDGQPLTLNMVRSAAAAASAADALGPAQCVAIPAASSAAETSSNNADARHADSAAAADAMWLADLSGVLSGWQWQRSSWTLSVPAGRVVTGVGVAIHCSDGSCSSSGAAGVLGALGTVELRPCTADGASS